MGCHRKFYKISAWLGLYFPKYLGVREYDFSNLYRIGEGHKE